MMTSATPMMIGLPATYGHKKAQKILLYGLHSFVLYVLFCGCQL